MKEKGAEVETYYTNELKINPCQGPCQGDMSCMRSTGKCYQDDDMEWLLPKVSQADILIFASPLYCDGVTGPMKMFIDRLSPMRLLTMEIHDNHIRHPIRKEWNVKRVVLVSSCGFWEIDNFDPMKAHIKAFCDNMSAVYAGELLRPHGPILGVMLENNMSVDDVIESARNAGHELIEDGEISSKTSDNISRPLLSRDAFLQMVNAFIYSLSNLITKLYIFLILIFI